MSEFRKMKSYETRNASRVEQDDVPDGMIRKRKKIRKKRGGEGSFGKEKESSNYVKRASFLLLFVTILFLGYTMVRFFKRQPKAENTLIPELKVVTDDYTVAEEKWVGKSPAEVAEGFVQAKTVAEKMVFVRDAAKVEQAMQQFFTQGAGKEEVFEKLEVMPRPPVNLSDHSSDEPDFEHFVVRLKGCKPRMLAIVKTEQGCKVDFPCYARLCSASWADILAGKITEADVRGFITPTNYFNFNYTDDQKWGCVALTSAEMSDDFLINIYFDRSELKNQPLLNLKNMGSRRMYLRIKSTSPENVLRKQYELVEILSKDWTYP